VLHLQALAGARRLGGHLDYVALDVEFPAVVQAAQPAILVTAEEQRSAAMRAALAQHAHGAVGIAEHHQVLADQARPHRRAVLLRHLLDQAHRQPVPPHDLPHRRRAFDAAEELVLFPGQHT
jgi:hypothetical protein